MINDVGCTKLNFSSCTNKQFVYPAHSTWYMPALTIQYRAIGIMILNIMVVEDLPMVFSFTYLASAHSLRFNRVRPFKPVDHIKIVNMLFCDVIATKPNKIIPVTHLVFHLRLSFLAFTNPYTIVVPPGLRRSNVSNLVFQFIQFTIRILVMTLQTYDHVPFF